MFYVCIDGVSDEFLAFLGYLRVAEDAQFIVYRHQHTNEDHLVEKSGRRYFYVEDMNDAIAINAKGVVRLPTPPKK